MTRLELEAWGATQATGLDQSDVRALAASRAVDVSPGWQAGTWTVRASSFVGVLRAGETEIRIRPRIPVARLLYLLGYAQNPRVWTEDPVDLDDQPDLWPAMAQVFVRQAEKATERGILQGYRTEESALPVLRGRLRAADQLRTRAGIATPLELRYDEYDVDVPENQILRAAAERLLKSPDHPPVIVRRLRHLISRLHDVGRLVPGQRLPHVTQSRLNQHYQPALTLARMVLATRSIDIANAGVRATGFLVNMNTAFEDFVTTALTQALQTSGGRCAPQDQSHPMDEDGAIRLRPDLVWYAPSGAVRAVVDAKYKAESPAGFPYADLYQLLAYCTATALRIGHLVYAEGDADQSPVMVRNSDIVIRRHVLQLHRPVPELQAQVATLARDIAHQGDFSAR
ncbi:McrBC 5-methylcytosine restriction system component-like [Serinicoccus hydrothermalis]|uniref:McrBC 5-methylcytosine restriction system component-like n=1 Tax=Serinicoccus hydrothermalis TaxID=1758689 RepID=A0A1B1NFH4_9MICO|nr:hypothetical protein [Serinicoccus hydrothermalis]ANS80115.1 McrBC 5-methylcytosine restriction system component-like [Serinicoccus hydrothermalis]